MKHRWNLKIILIQEKSFYRRHEFPTADVNSVKFNETEHKHRVKKKIKKEMKPV